MRRSTTRLRGHAGVGRSGALIAAALGALLLLVGAAPQALAGPAEWRPFAQCPLANPSVEEGGCIVARTTSGSELQVGSLAVPLSRPIALRLGFREDPEVEALELFGAEYGDQTLSRTAQSVPGGLEAVVDTAALSATELARYEKVLAGGHGAVSATIELAGPASSIFVNELALLSATGTALGLPIQVRLSNPFLGPACYLGSNSDPIVVDMTTGATEPPAGIEPILGRIGEFVPNEEDSLLTLFDDRLVNNTLIAPAVSGCGRSGGADAALDARFGLPAAAGQSSFVLEATLKQAGAGPAEEHLQR
jgi:hypothetical protein